MAGFPYGETVTRLRPGEISDPYSGDTVEDWSSPAEFDIDGAGVEPAQMTATETRNAVSESRQQTSSGFTLYLPTGTDITARDRVRVRGSDHRVTGVPADWRSPFTGWRPGLVVTVERVEG